jgi:sec-independent protein translocase protein TatC
MLRKAKVIDHFQELVFRLKIIVVILAIATLIVLPFSPNLLKVMQNELLPKEWKVIVVNPIEAVNVELLISFTGGFLISFPVIIYEIYKFLKPALFSHEKKLSLYFIFGFLGLFAVGTLFAYFLLVPLTFKILFFFVTSTGATPLMSLENFFEFTLFSIASTGLLFTFPVFMSILAKLGVISSDVLSKNRKYFLAGLFVITAIITPDPTIITDLIIIIPIWFLYEISIILVKRIRK